MLQRYKRFFIFLACLILPLYHGSLLQAEPLSDTTKIRILFENGNRFIEGPSDSLVYYYEKAMDLIRYNLADSMSLLRSDPELLKHFKHQEVRANIGLGIEFYYQNRYDQAMAYYREAYKRARELDDHNLISECNSEIGILLKNQGYFEKAQKYYENALDHAKMTRDSSWIAACEINLGNIYKKQGYYFIAQMKYINALQTLSKLGHQRWMAACYENIGDIYNIQKDYTSALDYFNKALDIAKSIQAKERLISVYLQLAYVHLNMQQYDTARFYVNQAFPLYEQTGYQHEQDEAFILLGDTYAKTGDYDTALQFYNKALIIAQNKKDIATLADLNAQLGSVFLNLQQKEKALDYFTRSHEDALKTGRSDLIVLSHKNLAEIYEAMQKPAKALMHYQKFIDIRDSLFTAEKYKAIKELEIQHKLEEKEEKLSMLTEQTEIQEIKLNRRNTTLFVLSSGIVLVLLIAYLLYLQSRLIAKHRAIELEQQLLRTQMNPHFIFNSLIAIQSYIYKKEPLQAGDYLAKFADLVRLTLENSRREFLSLKSEIKTLKLYLELQAMRFESVFDFELHIDPDIDVDQLLVPPMFSQPFVENAIEHGLRHKNNKGQIQIDYRLINHGCIQITVKDNGIGREKAKEISNKKKHNALALKITEQRLTAFSKKFKQSFYLEVMDLKDNGRASGTKVIVLLPVKMSNQ